MLTLLLMRHAKSDWEAPHGDDHARPLAKRGKKAAASMGKRLTQLGLAPEKILSSSAERARSTARAAAKSGRWAAELEVTDAFYEASPEAVIATVRELEEAPATLLLVGHEPTWSQLLSTLIGGGNFRFPTGAVAALEVDAAGWAELGPGRCRLLWLLTPKLVEKGED
ncbi:MAG TPA: histidine phosphatase family protein [Thermoanaerobaculia bacterium]|nr:histidine phosphatase family protein [Thermoanaerobaculia bacterium]